MNVLQRGETERGVALLDAVLREGLPRSLHADAHGNLGTGLSMLGRYKEAIAVLRTSLATAGKHQGNTRYNLGILLADSGRKAEAEAQYRVASRLEPTLEGAHNNLGNLLADAGRREEAAGAYRAAIVAKPTHSMAYNNLGNILRGDSEGTDDVAAMRAAGRLYTTAIRLNPAYLEAYRNLGNLLKERPEWRRSAVRAYRAALSLQPDGRTVLMNMGEVLQWLGRPAAANATFALGVERGVWQHAQQRPSQYLPGLRSSPWWELSALPSLLAARLSSPSVLATLREEGLALLRRGGAAFQPYLSPALSSGTWTDVTLALAGALLIFSDSV